MWKHGSLILVAVVARNATAWADDTAKPTADLPGWAMVGQAGFAKTSGTSDTTSGNLLFHAAHTAGDWKYLFGTDGFYGANNGETTAQRWDLFGQVNYNITPDLYWYGRGTYAKDRFSGFEYQEALTTGAGYQFINTPDTRLTGQIGVGERRQRSETFVKDAAGGIVHGSIVAGSAQSDAVVDAGVTFSHAFNPSTKVLAGVDVLSGSNNTTTTASVALQVKMNSRLSLAAGYSLVSNSKVAAPASKTNSLTTLNLVYELKNPDLAPQ